jgi:hypothetical protein
MPRTKQIQTGSRDLTALREPRVSVVVLMLTFGGIHQLWSLKFKNLALNTVPKDGIRQAKGFSIPLRTRF